MLVAKLKDWANYIAMGVIAVALIALTVLQFGPVIYYTSSATIKAIMGVWNWIF